MDSEPKMYEISYLLSPALDDGGALTHAGKITTLIVNEKGAVNFIEEPKKRRLAYPIKKESQAYFGWTKFKIAPECIANLQKKLKAEEAILRYLIVEDEVPIIQPIRIPKPIIKPPPQRKEEPAGQLDLEALDKKLEEILG